MIRRGPAAVMSRAQLAAEWQVLAIGDRIEALVWHVRPFARSELRRFRSWSPAFRQAHGDPVAMMDDLLADVALVLCRKQDDWIHLGYDRACAYAYKTLRYEVLHGCDRAKRTAKGELLAAAVLEADADPTVVDADPGQVHAQVVQAQAAARLRCEIIATDGPAAWDDILEAAPASAADVMGLFQRGRLGSSFRTAMLALLGPLHRDTVRYLGPPRPSPSPAARWVAARLQSGRPLDARDAVEDGVARTRPDALAALLDEWANHRACTLQPITAHTLVDAGLCDHITSIQRGSTLERTRLEMASHLLHGLARRHPELIEPTKVTAPAFA